MLCWRLRDAETLCREFGHDHIKSLRFAKAAAGRQAGRWACNNRAIQPQYQYLPRSGDYPEYTLLEIFFFKGISSASHRVYENFTDYNVKMGVQHGQGPRDHNQVLPGYRQTMLVRNTAWPAGTQENMTATQRQWPSPLKEGGTHETC